MVKPTALHKEKRPPTQSQSGKIFSSAIPKSSTLGILLETATKCLKTSASLAFSINHVLAVVALLMVSWVVKVLETITNRVVSGL